MTGIELGTLAAISSIASGVFSAIGAISQGNAQAALARRNAQQAEQDAIRAEQEAAFEESATRSRTRRLRSSQRAALSATGGGVDTGSGLLITEETAVEGEIDALTRRYAGRVGASQAIDRAAAERFKGSQAQSASILRAGSSLLTGVGGAITASSDPRLQRPAFGS